MHECCSRSSNVDLAGVAPGRRDGGNLSSWEAKLNPWARAREGGQGGARLFPLGQFWHGRLWTPPWGSGRLFLFVYMCGQCPSLNMVMFTKILSYIPHVYNNCKLYCGSRDKFLRKWRKKFWVKTTQLISQMLLRIVPIKTKLRNFNWL